MASLISEDSNLMLRTASENSGHIPLVSIVILNFNGEGYLKECFESILKQHYQNFEIIFVDNASVDRSVEFVKKMFSNNSRFKIIQNSENLGAALGRNIGARAAEGKYVVFLDNDTEVTSEWINELINAMEKDSTIGIAQSTLLKMDAPDTIQHAGMSMIDFCGWTWKLHKNEIYGNFVKKHRRLVTIFGAATAAMIIRRDMLDEIGLFDPKFFIYFEDTDLSWRMWLRGYKVVSVPQSVVYHREAGSVKKEINYSEFTEYNYNRNCLRMIIKNYSLKHTLTFLPTTCVCLSAKALFQVVRTQGRSVIALVKAFFWNIMEIRDTIRERIIVQQTRKVCDEFIIRNAMRRLSLAEIINRI